MDSLKELEGKRVTIWKSGNMGFGWSKKGTVTEVEIGPYAQYNEAAFVYFKPYRARKVRRLVILPCARFLIWEGYHDVDTEVYGAAHESASGALVQMSRASSFSSFWMEQAANSVSVEPFYAQGA